MSFPHFSYIDDDVIPGLLLISTTTNNQNTSSNLLNISLSEFEEQLQNLLLQRTNLLNPLNQTVNPTIINEIPGNDILKFCGDYRSNNDKLTEVSNLISIINDNKKTINDAYKNINEGLKTIFEFIKTNENHRDIYSDIINNIPKLVSASLDSASKNELNLLSEQTKLSNYISDCVELFKIVETEMSKKLVKKNDEKVNISCPVCYEKNVNCVYIPCGHTICNICSTKVISNSCIICRKKAKVIPFYLS
jgi:hypothetical protein